MPDFFGQVFEDETGLAARKAARKPWWLRRTSVRQGLMMAGSYFGLAAVASVASFFVTLAVPRMFAVLWPVFSAWPLVSALVLRRREPRACEASAPAADCRDDLESRPWRAVTELAAELEDERGRLDRLVIDDDGRAVASAVISPQ
jgi:hypothetical protein